MIVENVWYIIFLGRFSHNALFLYSPLCPLMKDSTISTVSSWDLIHRESFSEIPPRVEYSLTEDGKQFCEAVLPLIQWAKKRDTSDKCRCLGSCHEDRVLLKKVE